ncbi:hypothetical protein SUGI_1043380 [Cryptomeria japonica]|nr:hypothetical protein SUGI_1043380 [Cryptomeria japonica]
MRLQLGTDLQPQGKTKSRGVQGAEAKQLAVSKGPIKPAVEIVQRRENSGLVKGNLSKAQNQWRGRRGFGLPAKPPSHKRWGSTSNSNPPQKQWRRTIPPKTISHIQNSNPYSPPDRRSKLISIFAYYLQSRKDHLKECALFIKWTGKDPPVQWILDWFSDTFVDWMNKNQQEGMHKTLKSLKNKAESELESDQSELALDDNDSTEHSSEDDTSDNGQGIIESGGRFEGKDLK